MYAESFPSKLKEARKKTGFTQREVSQELLMSEASISRYEKGEREPDIETLGTLANFYGVSVDWLIGLGMQKGNAPNYINNKKSITGSINGRSKIVIKNTKKRKKKNDN